jgi:hypothetical protein
LGFVTVPLQPPAANPLLATVMPDGVTVVAHGGRNWRALDAFAARIPTS